MVRFIFPVVLMGLVFNFCSSKPVEAMKEKDANSGGIEVTFYPAYGYRNGTTWIVPVRSWVHENRNLASEFVAKLAQRKIKCDGLGVETLKLRSGDFLDDDKWLQKVTIQFDSDPDGEQYQLGRSGFDGLIEAEIKLSEAKARKLLESQGSSQGWLAYHAVSGGHTGKGRIRLIEPEGVSIVTDIDDTIKVTEVPAEKSIVLRNTFCRDFVAAPGMADMYREMGDIPVHYVSGGPWQLYGPLYDFLVSGQGGYPEGIFSLSYFPKNILAKDTVSILVQTLAGPLEKTYRHKISEISSLMERFRGRKFILVGDSGELDPEVYRWVKDNYSEQVKDIWIRDVVNDAEVNPDRLKGMRIIKSEPVICATQSHHSKIAAMIGKLNGTSYARNRLSPCNQQ